MWVGSNSLIVHFIYGALSKILEDVAQLKLNEQNENMLQARRKHVMLLIYMSLFWSVPSLLWLMSVLIGYCVFSPCFSPFLSLSLTIPFVSAPFHPQPLPYVPLDAVAQWAQFWHVLWRLWRPDCSPLPSLSTSLKSSSAPSTEPVWPV